jgi:hypothetical protein
MPSDSNTTLYDVVAINIRDGSERVLDRDKTESNAEAIIMMAIMRRGVETEFYTARPIWESL